ncbi:Fancd2 [Drosophila busckii]|uniref:Fancd2 n=1 Tax=Drosophila busckii TaxID=30019 RepID=A0A0M4EIW5_DROBS|nr:Fancd2 [Drosophila busckii]
MYRKLKKKAQPLNAIDENASIKIPRLAPGEKIDASIQPMATNESEEEKIPASQEQALRFLSQHSIAIAATLGRTQSSSKINSARQPNSFFEMVLVNAGVQLDQPDTFVLCCDHIAIVSKLRDILVRSPKYPENIETFKNGLNNALAPKSKIAHKLLSGCTIDIADENQAYQSQNSMFINFLMIDFLREPCLDVLFKKIEEISLLEDALSASGGLSLLPLMLEQLRYLTLSHSEQIYAHIERIFNNASESAKLDIINSAEFVLDARKHDDFVELLIINYASSKELFQINTVQMLSNLTLSSKSESKLRARIIEFIKNDSSCSNVILPHLIRLLLNCLNQDTDEVVRELVSTLREIFNWHYRSQSEEPGHIFTPAANDKELQLELFSFLHQGLTRSKRFYQMWQRVLAALPATEFNSFDFIMLLLLIHINEDNTLYIENLLRRRIKLEHITVDILDEVRSQFPHILEKHISTLMHILQDFVREKNQIVSDFAKLAYSILFKIGNSIQKNILKKLLELTFDKSAQHVTSMALTLLRELQLKNSKHVQNCATLLLPLLDRLSDFTLPQTRLAMDLLSRVAYPDPKLPECTQLQEQIEMIVKKQQINRSEYIKKQGIIGGVQLIDAVARIESKANELVDLDTSIDNIATLPEGRSKHAANLIMLTQSAIGSSPELMALFYDELASVLAVRSYNTESNYTLDNKFLIWMTELMSSRFLDSFVSEQELRAVRGIQLKFQKNINELEDTKDNSEYEILNIGINISGTLLTPTGSACNTIYELTPLFNLVSVLSNQRWQHSLEQINALLGCAIILPEFFDDDNYLSIFDNYDEELQKKILHIYFHTVNWMRANIGAFSTQACKATRKRVLYRLADLLSVEQRMKPLLAHAPIGFVPPPCQFLKNCQTSVQHGSRAKPKAGKTKVTHNDSTRDESSINKTKIGDISIKLSACKTPVKTKIDFEQLYGTLERYRPLDVGIIALLKEEPFTAQYPLDPEQLGTHLGLMELRFILTDLVHKLSTVVKGEQNLNEAESLRSHVVKPEYFMSDLFNVLEALNKHLNVLAAHINEQLEKVNNLHSNLDLFKDRINYVKTCFGLCIHLFALYFSWSEWSDKTQAELLQSSLRAVLLTAEQSTQARPSATNLAAQAFQYFLQYEKSVLTLSTAVQLYRLLCSLRKLSNSTTKSVQRSSQQAEDIRKFCTKMLRRKWYHYTGCLEKGAQCNLHLDELVKGFLKDSSIERQRDILRGLSEECVMLNTKDKSLDSFPNIKKANFPLLFRGLCEILITTLSSEQRIDLAADRFELWESTIRLLNGLLEVVKKVEQPRNFALFLKHSQLYLKLLLQHGLTILETIVRRSPERLTKFLHELQNVTKFLHNLCCHSKTMKNTAIISYIPILRETLETLVFRVKALLAAIKCHAAFHLSILDNKDLHGDAIRTPTGSFATEVNSDEEIPEDDDSVDETILNENITDTSVSSSTRRSKSSSRSKCF